jgi:hypothetical protein
MFNSGIVALKAGLMFFIARLSEFTLPLCFTKVKKQLSEFRHPL